MEKRLVSTSDDQPDKVITTENGKETVEILPPRMDPTLAANAALLAQQNT